MRSDYLVGGGPIGRWVLNGYCVLLAGLASACGGGGGGASTSTPGAPGLAAPPPAPSTSSGAPVVDAPSTGTAIPTATTTPPDQSRWMGRGPSMLKVPGKGRVKAFYIDRTEVSWGDYVAMLTFFERDVMTTHTEHPTHGVKLAFDEAEEYCAWAGKRLLTFAEWQRVVGPNPQRSMGEEPEPVDARPPNELGIFGLENGLMEWTQTDSAMAGYKLIGGLDMDPPALPVDGNVMGVRCAADADKVPRPSASNPAP